MVRQRASRRRFLGLTAAMLAGTAVAAALPMPALAAPRTVKFTLGTVEIHRELITAAARWIMASKLWSVLSARMAMRLNSLSLQKKFSIR